MSEAALDAARGGDASAFAEVTAPYLRELRVHCYRMLGSLVDAEDLLQEAMIAAWQGLPGFAGRSSLRTWLYQIATNRCLNAIRAEKRRKPPEPVAPFAVPEPSRRGEITWLQPCPDAWLDRLVDPSPGPEARYQIREAVELAFITALQRLPPRQTAALLLCDVLGFAIIEAAAMLDTTTAAVKSALQRARAALDPVVADSRSSRAADIGDSVALAREFADAFSVGDVERLVELLTDDAWLAMPPAPHEYHGPAAVGTFLRASTQARGGADLVLVPTAANNQPAFLCYTAGADGTVLEPVGMVVLTLNGGRISAITRFLDAQLPALFDAR